MFKTLIALLLAVVLTSSALSLVKAEEVIMTPRPRISIKAVEPPQRELKEVLRTQVAADRQAALEEKQTQQAEKMAVRCVEASQKLTEHLGKSENFHQGELTRYKGLQAKLQTVITEAQKKGIDVTQLQANLAQLQVKITEQERAITAYLDLLEAAKLMAPQCGTLQGEYAAKLQAVRTQQQVVKTNSADIRQFIRNSIQPLLVKAKKKYVQTIDSSSMRKQLPTGALRPVTRPSVKPMVNNK